MAQLPELLSIQERVAVLETHREDDRKLLEDIDAKLDSLLHLKSKGMGAFWVISGLVGSGIIGAIVMVWEFFFKHTSHL